MAGKGSKRKLYLIGIDAASGWIIRDLCKKYNLQGFEKFMEDGAFTDMESVLPPMTGPSWPSIYTGVRPSEHGVPEFLKMEPNYTKTVVFYDPTLKEPFWDKLAREGLRSLVMTPAMLVRPSKEKNVDMMTGFPLPARFSSKEMEQVARKHNYIGEPDMEVDMKSGKITLKQASDRYIEAIEARSRISRELIEKNDYEMSFICFTETDRMQHFSLNQPNWDDYVLPLYEKISSSCSGSTKGRRRKGRRFLYSRTTERSRYAGSS